ncbi:MAG: hypothetical protein IJ000_01480 [Paludibacteraceae bacterium]|nr:hypothetical protein [Paludibacteraceae bacterium]
MAQKILSALGIGIIAMLFLVSCKDEPSLSKKLTFKGVDLSNAKALALVQEGGNAANAPRRLRADGQDPDEPTHKFLYTVDEDGNMHAAIFYFNEADSTMDTKALRLSIENIFAVGDNYLWLYGCQYDCDDLDLLPEKARKYVQEQIDASRKRPGHYNYLIRKTDGALFDLTNLTVLPIDWDGSIKNSVKTSNDLKQYGMVAQVGKELYWAEGNYQGGLRKLVDNGSTMDQVNLDYHANIAYVIGDGNGHLGTVLSYSSNMPTNPAFINGNLANLVQGLPNDMGFPRMHFIGGKYFVSHGYNWDSSLEPAIYTISFEGNTAQATLAVAGHSLPEYGYGYPCRVEGSTYSYLTDEGEGAIIRTFDANTLSFSVEKLPEGFPSWNEAYDEEGNAYSMETEKQTDMTYVIVYNLPTCTATRHEIDRSDVPQYNVIKVIGFDRSMKAMIEEAILPDGSTVSLITYMTGENAFKTVVMGTEASGTAVVATIVQLN